MTESTIKGSLYTNENFGTVSVPTGAVWNEIGTYTISEAGVYIITYVLRFNANATGIRGCALSINSSTDTPYVARQDVRPAISGYQTYAMVTALAAIRAGSFLSLRGLQNSGAELSAAPRIEMIKI